VTAREWIAGMCNASPFHRMGDTSQDNVIKLAWPGDRPSVEMVSGICGDCYVGNLGTLAHSNARVETESDCIL
jgi:hypothetical protein